MRIGNQDHVIVADSAWTVSVVLSMYTHFMHTLHGKNVKIPVFLSSTVIKARTANNRNGNVNLKII